ncbi:unnamed protein product [Rotaria magnacalcarata]|uniref:Uncharacterized protein n=1 Tax=Rotaria magnacalcarata TaxID=392030 RepID=A0A8S2TF34_9BILA|nr:unnamed protein product [Rotaria magnacalcarata]
MTSLVLFNSEPVPAGDFVKPGVDWGTAKKRNRLASDPSHTHPAGTYLYKGEPIEQNYRNTDITLSNVRINDELIPAPQTVDVTPHQIPLKFPANHPFSSHISEKALFPNSSANFDDHPSTSMDPYMVPQKVRGNPFRREVHYQGLQRERYQTSKWPDKQYMQLPRSSSDVSSSPIYPWPRKMFVPNDDSACENSGTHIVKNKERASFETSYQNDFTYGEGIGVPQIARDRQASNQQMEAENRLKQLELIRPEDNINLLNLKFRVLQSPRHGRPILPQYRDLYVNTLYDQLGTYVQERSGLYQTVTYDPNALVQSIPDIEKSENNEQENDHLLKDDNHLGDLLDYGEQTQDKSKPNLFQYKTFQDYQNMRSRLLNKCRVPQDANTVNARIQEGNTPFIQRESTYGDSYNTRKFLQENILSSDARSDPTSLMSTRYNTNIERARSMNSYPMKPMRSQSLDTNDHNNNNNDKEKSNDITVGPLLQPSPYDELYATNHITEHTNGYSRRSENRVYDSPFKNKGDMLAYKFYEKKQTPIAAYLQVADPLSREAKTPLHLPGPEMVARFIDPKLAKHSTYQQSYQDLSFHENISPMQDSRLSFDESYLSMKDSDPRFGRTADGRVKQWKLIDLQDRWTKTKAQRQYHMDHPESVPYVGDGTVQAKKEIVIADIVERQRMMTVR